MCVGVCVPVCSLCTIGMARALGLELQTAESLHGGPGSRTWVSWKNSQCSQALSSLSLSSLSPKLLLRCRTCLPSEQFLSNIQNFIRFLKQILGTGDAAQEKRPCLCSVPSTGRTRKRSGGWRGLWSSRIQGSPSGCSASHSSLLSEYNSPDAGAGLGFPRPRHLPRLVQSCLLTWIPSPLLVQAHLTLAMMSVYLGLPLLVFWVLGFS